MSYYDPPETNADFTDEDGTDYYVERSIPGMVCESECHQTDVPAEFSVRGYPVGYGVDPDESVSSWEFCAECLAAFEDVRDCTRKGEVAA